MNCCIDNHFKLVTTLHYTISHKNATIPIPITYKTKICPNEAKKIEKKTEENLFTHHAARNVLCNKRLSK